jgi:hypothetical protein
METIDQLFQRLVDEMGYRDAKTIPVEDVRRMFVAFFNTTQMREEYLRRRAAKAVRCHALKQEPPPNSP